MGYQHIIDDLKKQLKKMEDKNVNRCPHLWGKCRVLWDDFQRRDAEEDDDNLLDAIGQYVAVVEEEERR